MGTNDIDQEVFEKGIMLEKKDETLQNTDETDGCFARKKMMG